MSIERHIQATNVFTNSLVAVNTTLDGLKWPSTDGTADQVLKTDGSGTLSWTDNSGGGGGGITGAASTIDTEDLTANRALISNASGKVAISSVTHTELGHLSGVTSAIQTQLDAKHASLTFGIANTNAVRIDHASVADDHYARFTANGLEGRSVSEIKTDLSLNNVENTALSSWTGSTNITTVGNISSLSTTGSNTLTHAGTGHAMVIGPWSDGANHQALFLRSSVDAYYGELWFGDSTNYIKAGGSSSGAGIDKGMYIVSTSHPIYLRSGGGAGGKINLKNTDTTDNSPITLTLQTGELDIEQDDVIGAIDFQAPDEENTGDANLVCAGIEAVSEGDFSSSSNATKLSFKTGASEAAAEKMSLSSAGVLTIGDPAGSGVPTFEISAGVGSTGRIVTIGNSILSGTPLSGGGSHDNVLIGSQAAASASSVGFSNIIAIGTTAGFNSDTNWGNVCVGTRALYNAARSGGSLNLGSTNVGIGYESGRYITTGFNNIVIGNKAAAPATGEGIQLTTGSDNVVIGVDANISLDAATNQIVIGQGATGQADNSVTLGNADVTDVYMAQDKGATVHCAGINTGLVTLTATGSITAAAHAGRTLLLGVVGGAALVTLTLPAATGSGNIYTFIVSVVNTSNYVIQVANATDVIQGTVHTYDNSAGGTLSAPWKTVEAQTDTITLNGGTTGGYQIGDKLVLIDILNAGTWAVSGNLTANAGGGESIATPFSAAV